MLVVTEPTLSGLHDLKRVLETAGHFNIPAAVCVNKFDINPENHACIEDFCAQQAVRVVGRVPYDRSVVAALMQKKHGIRASLRRGVSGNQPNVGYCARYAGCSRKGGS